MNELLEQYRGTIVPNMKTERKYSNMLEVPRITKIVVNMAVGHNAEKDALSWAADDLAALTGQRPMLTKARISVSNFKLREGMLIGAKVTLRGERMYEFLQRLIHVALPRIRDFRGVSARGFDGRGNFSLGLNDQSIFAEIDPNKVKRQQGMDISIVTTAKSDEEARELLAHFGMPFASN
jgi:large subunit ribosomal protein L5